MRGGRACGRRPGVGEADLSTLPVPCRHVACAVFVQVLSYAAADGHVRRAFGRLVCRGSTAAADGSLSPFDWSGGRTRPKRSVDSSLFPPFESFAWAWIASGPAAATLARSPPLLLLLCDVDLAPSGNVAKNSRWAVLRRRRPAPAATPFQVFRVCTRVLGRPGVM